MRKLSKRSTAVVAGLAVVVFGGGAAFAAANGWDILGSGTANAQASEIKNMTATTTFNKHIYPGAVVQMTTKVANPNEFPVKLTNAITVTATDVTITPADAACKAGILTPGVLTTSFPGTPTIAAGATAQEVTTALTVGTTLPQGCAGKAIEVKYAFSGVSQP